MITNIRLQNFRSYSDAAFELDKGVNIIVGPNTSGKTNLLEAILVIARGSSYRAKNGELVKFNKNWSRLDANISDGGLRTVKLTLKEEIATKTFEINNHIFKRLPLTKTLPAVLFEPQHLQLLTGRPDIRRDYIDDLLEQIVPGYGINRRAYKRVLSQRNALLKKGQLNASQQLFAWNVRLSELGGKLVAPRLELVLNLSEQINNLYKQLSHTKAKVNIDYISSVNIENYSSALLKKLEASEELDFIRGFTAYGPHRDDINTQINGYSAQAAASRGEIRTLLLAFKIQELKMLEQARGQKPILLLDDVFSELDGARRKALTGYLQNYQTFITTTDADLVVHNFAQKCNIIPLV